jgi:hypothetical protein
MTRGIRREALGEVAIVAAIIVFGIILRAWMMARELDDGRG